MIFGLTSRFPLVSHPQVYQIKPPHPPALLPLDPNPAPRNQALCMSPPKPTLSPRCAPPAKAPHLYPPLPRGTPARRNPQFLRISPTTSPRRKTPHRNCHAIHLPSAGRYRNQRCNSREHEAPPGAQARAEAFKSCSTEQVPGPNWPIKVRRFRWTVWKVSVAQEQGRLACWPFWEERRGETRARNRPRGASWARKGRGSSSAEAIVQAGLE